MAKKQTFGKQKSREQSLLPVLDVFSVSWIGKRLMQGTAAEMLPRMNHDPAFSR